MSAAYTSSWDLDGRRLPCTPVELFPAADGRVLDVQAMGEPDGTVTVYIGELGLDAATARAIAAHVLQITA